MKKVLIILIAIAGLSSSCEKEGCECPGIFVFDNDPSNHIPISTLVDCDTGYPVTNKNKGLTFLGCEE